MRRTTKRRGVTLLGAVAAVAFIYLAMPVQANVNSATTGDVLCVRSSDGELVLADCSETGWLEGLIGSDRFQTVQSKFRDPIY